MTTMREVAEAAGVSIKTVSRVFHGDPYVKPPTRERVQAALRALNYTPNALARSFRSGKVPVIGVAVPDIADSFFASIAKSIEQVVAARDMSTIVATLGEDPAREQRLVEALLRRGLSGLVIAPIAEDQSYLQPWANTPLVFIDRHPTRLIADSFTHDDVGGARMATSHLAAHGHRRIAFVGDRLTLPTTRHRLDGYRDALRQQRLPVDDELVLVGGQDHAGAARALRTLRALADPPTAIFSSTAACTMALTLEAQASWHPVIVGFGDFPMAGALTPPVTVIDQDPFALGVLAAERVLDRADHPNRRYRRRTILPVQLLERHPRPLSLTPVTSPRKAHHDAAALG